jgi:hypothetical protein
MNHKRIYQYVTLAACLFGATAQARLGESLEQCILRYGQPIEKMADGGQVFLKEGIVVTTHFDHDVCDLIIYLKKDDTAFTPEEAVKIVQVVNSNNGKRHWEIHGTFDKHPKGRSSYWLSDDGFVAKFNDNGLVIRKDPNFKPRKEALDGF